jgi:lipoyl(octanoyl) transferase
LEHPHVYTLGKAAICLIYYCLKNNLKKRLRSTKLIGGDITYHGPGQIVGYPIIDLENFFTDIHKYLRFLEEAIILTLQEYGIECGRSDGETGVWLGSGTPFAKNLCHGRPCFALGYHARICFKCRLGLF